MSAAIIAVYIWAFLSTNKTLHESVIISLPVLILAGVTAFISFVSYIWTPRKAIFALSLTIYLLLASMVALLIVDTGGVFSPFIALLVLIVIFSDVFGLWGLIPMLMAISVFVASQYIGGKLTTEALIIVCFSGFVPLIASLMIWYNASEDYSSNDSNKDFNNLADKLNEVANKSEVVINAIGDGVMAIDNKGIIQLINPAAQTIIGWGKQDALALNYRSVLHLLNSSNEVVDMANDPIQQVLNINQQVRINDMTLLTNSGKKIIISLVVSPVGESGSGVIVVFRDVTKERAEEREQAEFISTASHEMRTPVASIEGYLGLTLNPQTAQIDERARSFIMKAHEAAEHLGHLFQDLLDISKADDGRLPNKPKVINIIDFVHDIANSLEQKAIDKGLELIFNPMPSGAEKHQLLPVYYVHLDGDHIREIVNNLIENAIKYTINGKIIIDITGDDERIVVSVKDSGIGIPAEDIPHLFQKFYRVDNRDTREIGGTGLGLYLCRRLAEIMGGRIWVESQYNKGSTFYVELPRVSNQEASLLLEQESEKTRQEAANLDSMRPNVTKFEVTNLTNIASTPPQVTPKPATNQVVSTPSPTTPQLTARPQSISVPNRDIT